MRIFALSGAALLTLAAAARADGCDDFRTIALMRPEAVAAHERGVDRNWFDDSIQLSDLTLVGEPCSIETNDDGTVANVGCSVQLQDTATLREFFDAADECLKGSALKMSREGDDKDIIWIAGGAMVKISGGDSGRANVKFVY